MSSFTSKTIVYAKIINIHKKMKIRYWWHTSIQTTDGLDSFKNIVEKKKAQKKKKERQLQALYINAQTQILKTILVTLIFLMINTNTRKILNLKWWLKNVKQKIWPKIYSKQISDL